MQSRDPRRHLGAFLGLQLREIRTENGINSQDEMAVMVRKHRSVVSKAETGEEPPTDAVLKDWLDACGVQGRLREVLTGLARFTRMGDDGPGKAAPWFETEAKAHTLRYWAPVIVPGITQTPAYARALLTAMGYDDAQVTGFLDFRMGRQSIINRPDAPDITVVLWEPVLHHQIGSRDVMREQLGRLVELSRHPAITVHVLPSSLGANPGLGGAINLAATDDAPELLLSDGLVEDQLSQDPMLVRKARATFNNVRADALNRADSRNTLVEAKEKWSN
jgi:hypothetical protein